MADIQQILKLITQADASGMNAISGGLDSLGSKGGSVLGALGSGLKDIAIVGAAAGVAAAGFFTASVSAAADFQSAMSKIQGLAGASADQMQEYNQGILDMTSKIPVSAKDAADGLYFVVSAGYKGADAMQVLNTSAEAAAAGLGSTKDIANLVTSALTDYKLGADDAKTITDKLTAAVTDGKASADEFAPALAKVLPIAASMGINFDQVSASISTMTRAGLSASEAGTALRGTLSALDKPGKQAQDALQSIGLSAGELKDKIATEGLMQTLDDLMTLTGGDVETLGKIIPNIRGLTGVLASAGQQQDSYAQTLTDIQNSAGRTDKAFDVAKQTFNFNLGILKNDLNKILIEVGSALLPLITPIVQNLGKLIQDGGALIDQFFKSHQQQFVDFGTMIQTKVLPKIQEFFNWIKITALPIITGLATFITGTVAPAISKLIDEQIVPRARDLWAILQQVGDWFRTVVFPAALADFQAAMAWLGDHKELVVGALMGIAAAQIILTAAEVAGAVAAAAANLPLLLIIATIALLGAGVVELITHWDDIIKKFPAVGQAVNDMKADLQRLTDWLNSDFWPKSVAAFQAVVTWVQAHWGEITHYLTGPFEIAYSSLKGTFDLIKDVVQLQLQVLGDIISIALDLISGNWKGAWNDVKQLVSDVWDGIKTIVSDQLTDIKGVLLGAWDTIKAALMGPFEWFRDNIGYVISAAANFILAPINSVIGGFNALGRGITSAVNWVTNKLGLGNVLGDWTDVGGINVNVSFAPPPANTAVAGLASSGLAAALTTVATAGQGAFPGFAGGTSGMADGYAWVGEQGAELIHKKGDHVSVIPAQQAAKLASTLGMKIPGYFLGTPDIGALLGDVGDIGGAIKAAGSAAIGFAKEWIGKGVDKLVDFAFDQFGVKAPTLPGVLSGVGGAVFTQLKDKVVDAIKQIFDKGKSALGTTQPGTSAEVAAWIEQAITLAGADPSWEQGLDIIANYESGGDPSAYNPIDVGGGEHAQGLMQTIGSTFAAYAMAGHGNINDPVDNAIAAIRYIQARYGSINNVPGVASILSGGPYLPYLNGGLITEPVLGVGQRTGKNYAIGENANELIVGGNGDPALNLAAIASNTAITATHSGTLASVSDILRTAAQTTADAATTTADNAPDTATAAADTATATSKVLDAANKWLAAIWDTVSKIYIEMQSSGTKLASVASNTAATASASVATATAVAGPAAGASGAYNAGGGGLSGNNFAPNVFRPGGQQPQAIPGSGGPGLGGTPSETSTWMTVLPKTLADISSNTAETVAATQNALPSLQTIADQVSSVANEVQPLNVSLGDLTTKVSGAASSSFVSLGDIAMRVSTVADGVTLITPAIKTSTVDLTTGMLNVGNLLMNNLSTLPEKIGGAVAKKTIDLTGPNGTGAAVTSQAAAAAAQVNVNTAATVANTTAVQGLTIAQMNAIQASQNVAYAQERANQAAIAMYTAWSEQEGRLEDIMLQGTGIKTNFNFNPVNYSGSGLIGGQDSNRAQSLLNTSNSLVKHFARGGVLNEPVLGYGVSTGAIYSFAENAPETIGPSAGSVAPQIHHYHFAEGAVSIPAKDLDEMRSVQDFFDRVVQTQRAR